MRRLSPLLVLVALLAAASPAGAQSAPPPTKGALYFDGQSGRYLLAGPWLYRSDLANVGRAQGYWRDQSSTAGWSPVSVPNAYNAGNFSQQSMSGWVGWYRRDFTLPKGAFASYVPRSDRHWILRFESVNYYATVWLNGHEVGSHAGAYLPFEFDLSGLRPGVNRLVVRVDNQRTSTDLPPGPSGLWWNFGGIVREVYLRAVQRADIGSVMVRPLLRCPRCAARIQESAHVRNPTGQPQSVSLSGSYGHIPLRFGSHTIAPGATWTPKASVTVGHPRLWSIDKPQLYRAKFTLTDARGRLLQRYSIESGIRSITIRKGKLELNGRPVNLRGVSLHEQNLIEGSALTPATMQRMIGWVRTLGATIIRSHYPLNPEILQMADRDGILVWAEIPVYQATNAELASSLLLRHARAMLTENIAVNQNHPSVLLWSIGNELPTLVTHSEAAYIRSATALAHRLDPTRPVALDISDWYGIGCQASYGPLDALGVNEYEGYFDAGGGVSDDRDGLSAFLDQFHSCYPHKALFVTEFGFDGNRDGPVEVRGTYAFQSDSVAYHLGVFASKPWLSGAIYWLIQDFASKPGWAGDNPRGTPPFVQKGLVDLQGNEKPAFSLVSAIYHATQQIAPPR